MHIKWLNTGTGNAKHAADYVLADRDHKGELRAGVKVLGGDPDRFVEVANSLDFTYCYSSAVISWAPEDKPTPEQINEVLERFKQAAFAGLDESRFAYLAVQHKEADGGTHIHFLVARTDLMTGKSYNPAPPNWKHLYDPMRDHFNFKYGWARPDDPSRSRLIQPGHEAYDFDLANPKTAKQQIASWITRRVELGLVQDRDGVIASLKEIGEITRIGKKYISVKLEGMDKAIRLKGGLFDEQFNASVAAEIATKAEAGHGSGLAADQERAAEADQRFQERLARRAAFNKAKYGIPDAGDPVESAPVVAMATDCGADIGHGHDGRSLGVDELVGQANADSVLLSAVGHGRWDAQRQASNPVAAGLGSLLHGTNKKRESHLLDEAGKAGAIKVIWFKGRRLGELEDRGSQLIAHRFKSSKAAAYNIVRGAIGKGWQRVKFSGRDAFVREAMRMALDKGMEVVAKDDQQAKILEQVKKEKAEHDRVRKVAAADFDAAKRASRGLERASRALDAGGSKLERNSRELDSRVRRTGEHVKRGVKAMYDDELERFKTEINLADYMQTQGWRLNPKKSTGKTAVLESGTGRKALVSRNDTGQYLWHDPVSGAGGSIIDFVQSERGLNLGQVRKELRPLIGIDLSSQLPNGRIERHSLERSSNDEQQLVRVRHTMTHRYKQLKPLDDSFLRWRGIANSNDSRFSNVRTDQRGNTCFPHYNGGVVGWEVRNEDFKGYSKGGAKIGLYATTNYKTARRFVVVESGIDAMAHAELKQTGDKTAYVSLGGSIGKDQLKLLAELLKDKQVVVATDNDDAGREFARQIERALGRKPDRELPTRKDWNDDLIEQKKKKKERERVAARSRGIGGIGF